MFPRPKASFDRAFAASGILGLTIGFGIWHGFGIYGRCAYLPSALRQSGWSAC